MSSPAGMPRPPAAGAATTAMATVSRVEFLADRLYEAWSAGDGAARVRLLAGCCAPWVRYANPLGESAGVAGLAELIGHCLAPYPGHRPVRTSAIDLHHGCARWEWALRDRIGQVVLAGLDVVGLTDARPTGDSPTGDGVPAPTPDGPLLATVSTFFGAPPPRVRTYVFGAMSG